MYGRGSAVAAHAEAEADLATQRFPLQSAAAPSPSPGSTRSVNAYSWSQPRYESHMR